MKIYKCDKCLEIVEPINLTSKTYKDKEYSLCPDCVEEVDKILKKIEKNLDKEMKKFFNKK